MPSFVVGAYASLPQGREAQETYYDLLGEQPWIEGTELPFPGDLADTTDRIWLAGHLPKRWRGNTVTVIPGTMQHVWKDPNFGLASPDEDGRKVALAFMKQLREAPSGGPARTSSSSKSTPHPRGSPAATPWPPRSRPSRSWIGPVPSW